MNYQVHLDSTGRIARRKGLGKGGVIQKYIDSKVIRLSDPYVPLESGTLKLSGQLGTDLGSGVITYNSPYARYLYYGLVMEGRAPKQLTNRPITYHGAPKRGSYWFEKMKQYHGKAILKGAEALGKLNR